MASAGPLYLAANDDFSAYMLFRKHDVPFIHNNEEYTLELIVAEYPTVLKCPERLSEINTVFREFSYVDPHKRIVMARAKNIEEDFYAGIYSIITPRGRVDFVDSGDGHGAWDLLVDGINGHLYDSVDLCWIKRDDIGDFPFHHYLAPGTSVSKPNSEEMSNVEQIGTSESLDSSPEKE